MYHEKSQLSLEGIDICLLSRSITITNLLCQDKLFGKLFVVFDSDIRTHFAPSNFDISKASNKACMFDLKGTRQSIPQDFFKSVIIGPSINSRSDLTPI